MHDELTETFNVFGIEGRAQMSERDAGNRRKNDQLIKNQINLLVSQVLSR